MTTADLAAARARRARDRETSRAVADQSCSCGGYDGSHFGDCPQIADSLRIVTRAIRRRSAS